MQRVIKYAPRVAIFLAGVAAGALSGPRRNRNGEDPAAVEDLKRSIAELGRRLARREEAATGRLSQIETRLDEHAARLADIPSTGQIVAAMEQLLSKTMASLDERLTTQAHSIDVLKTTVSQTDGLLERVLESLDSLQGYADPAEQPQETVLQRPAM